MLFRQKRFVPAVDFYRSAHKKSEDSTRWSFSSQQIAIRSIRHNDNDGQHPRTSGRPPIEGNASRKNWKSGCFAANYSFDGRRATKHDGIRDYQRWVRSLSWRSRHSFSLEASWHVLESVEEEGYAHIVSWQVHGRCFMVHKPREFVELIQKYFNQSKLASFQRQLNLCKWLGVFNYVKRCAPEFLVSNRRLVHLLLFSDGFQRLTTGRDKGSYYHKDFLRGKRELCANLTRQKVKGTKVRRAIAPALEPQFYSMPFMPDKNGVTQALPSAATARRLMRIVSLENMQTANDVCFFEGKQFHYFDKSMVLAPSQCDASSLKRESNVIQTWMTVIED